MNPIPNKNIVELKVNMMKAVNSNKGAAFCAKSGGACSSTYRLE
ncbi:Uncharacterised protein [Bacillus freudenreichii]|nr:Uncharacterised protein [Bacillus freudenreichii]